MAANDRERLKLVDDVIAALASQAALTAALDGGVLANDTAVKARGARIFKAVDRSAKVFTGSTDLTRFGVWSASSADHANANAGTETITAGNGFAYTQLSVTKYTDTADPSYPGGGSARFTGETVAVQGAKHFSGLAEVNVTWTADAVGGTMSLVVSDLRDVSNGDRLAFIEGVAGGTADNLTGVKRLIFTEAAIGTNLATAAAGTATLAYDAVNLARVGGTGGEVHAQFVGQDVDGPLGVIGRWFVDDSTNLAGPIAGGFGAEVAP